MKTNLYFAAAMLLIMEACTISKPLPLPTDAAPASFRHVSSTDSSNIATIPWKTFFTDSKLQSLIDSSIAHNYDMQLALKHIESAKLVLGQSKYAYLPEARVQALGAINRPSDNSLNGLSLSQFLGKSYVEDYTISASLSWEADIWGKIKNQQAKALAAYLQTDEAKKAIQTNLVAAVAKGYHNLLMLDAQLGIAKKNLLLSDSTVNMVQLQYQAGQVTALAVQQSNAQRLLAAQLVPQLEQEIAIQENALSILSGSAPNAIARRNSLLETSITDKLSVAVPAALLQNRPDIKIKERELDIANANVGITKANLYPTLSITATGGINAFKASNWFSIPASLFAAGSGGITQPLFQRKQLKTQFELAKVERERTVLQFRQSVLNAVGEVSDALVRNSKLVEQQSIAANRSQTLQQAIGNAQLLFKNGMATYLEVITAQANVLQAELELAVLKKGQLDAQVELYRSLGGGWQ